MSQTCRDQTARAFLKDKRRNVLAKSGCHEFIVVCDGLKPNFNIGKIFRSAQAFGASEVHLVGVGQFNPYPSRGGFRHVPARFFDLFEESYQSLRARGYSLYVLDAKAGEALGEREVPPKSAFIFGHEEFGISFDLEKFPSVVPLAVPMYGTVESLNVSVAASIVMYEYVRQHGARIRVCHSTFDLSGVK